MFDKYKKFIQQISINIYGKIGVVLTTSSFIIFLVLELARISGILTNAYIGLISYLGLPFLFVLGLVLIPIGWNQRKKESGKTAQDLLSERFEKTDLKDGFFGSRLFLKIAIFTLINIIFLLFASSQMLSFMDEPVFCGTACHSVMSPEWTTYQKSPHARVKCVECHVGEGTDALISSKLNGMWQMISVTFDLLDRPIPTPVHQLRPARETCEKCHWPDKFYGDKLKKIVHYKTDEQTSPQYSTLLLKIDSNSGEERSGIHWHIAPQNEVRYTSVNDKREEMIWVEVLQNSGQFKRYYNKAFKEKANTEENFRMLDCVDCHNRATHIYEDPQAAIDKRIQDGLISRNLPFMKREGLNAISGNYKTEQTGLEAIATHIRNFYRREYSKISTSNMWQIDKAIEALQEIYSRNIHPDMNIEWHSYPNFLGHQNNSGCFRCHNSNMISAEGEHITHDCTTCHSILAYENTDPLKYLQPIEEKSPESKMQQYLYKEFKSYYGKHAEEKR